jgi:Fe-S cluster assembly protein SufD
MSANLSSLPKATAPGAGLEPLVQHYVAEHAAAAPSLPGAGSDWVAGLRRAALGRFTALGFPSPKDEHWRYTRLTPLAKRAFRLAPRTCVGMDEDDLAAYLLPGLECHRLVFVNGWYAPQLSRRGPLPEGGTVGSLAQVLADAPDRLRPWLEAGEYRNGFEALNGAFLGDGAVIHLDPDVVLERPVHLVFLSTRQAEATVAYLRNLVVAGRHSQARVIESYVGPSGEYFTNAVTTVSLGDGAILEHYKLQEESAKALHVARLDVRQGRDAHFTSHSVSFGGELTRNDVVASLDAEGAECRLNGLFMVDGRQHVDFHTSVEHERPHGTSREYFKGILGGRSRGVFNGRVHVHPGAQRTDSEQQNKNLLLSRDAEVDTKPELEIYADDVKCSHGATVGQLDPDMLFYLRARGIDETSARGLLTYGFAQDVIERMEVPSVRERIERLIVTRVPDAEYVKALV